VSCDPDVGTMVLLCLAELSANKNDPTSRAVFDACMVCVLGCESSGHNGTLRRVKLWLSATSTWRLGKRYYGSDSKHQDRLQAASMRWVRTVCQLATGDDMKQGKSLSVRDQSSLRWISRHLSNPARQSLAGRLSSWLRSEASS